MNDRIPPVLSDVQWATSPSIEQYTVTFHHKSLESQAIPPGSLSLSTVIAVANANLPDDDPRKITRAKLQVLRDASRALNASGYVDAYYEAEAFLAALESYLPPETP